MKERFFMADFETLTEKAMEVGNEKFCRVWAGCMTDIDKANWDVPTDQLDYLYSTSFSEWLEQALNISERQHTTIYFHNLKFDGSFILENLLNPQLIDEPWHVLQEKEKPSPKSLEVLISDGQWFSITLYPDWLKNKKGEYAMHNKRLQIRRVSICDSLKKIPVGVADMAKSYGLDVLKDELDYDEYRPVGHKLTDHEKYYIRHDVGIVAKVLKYFRENDMTNLTISSDAMADYKESIGDKQFKEWYPKLSDVEDEFVRQQYKGGWTFVNPIWKDVDCIKSAMIESPSTEHVDEWRKLGFTEKQIENAVVEVYDVNSLYPSRMYYELLPVGAGRYFVGEPDYDDYYTLAVRHFKCQYYLKPKHQPMIQTQCGRFTGQTVYSSESDNIVELYLTDPDFKLFFEQYEVQDYQPLDGYLYHGMHDCFKKYIDKHMEEKKRSKGAKRQIAKLFLNSLYGKFGTSKNATTYLPVYNPDEDKLDYVAHVDSKKTVYVPMAAFITAYARGVTIRAANACGDNFMYADTDSIHIRVSKNLPNIQIDQKELGAWKLEQLCVAGRYLRAKAYIELGFAQADEYDENGEISVRKDEPYIDVKCCGMNDRAKAQVTWENFHEGLTIESVNLKAKKIAGGTILKSTDFKIHETIVRK